MPHIDELLGVATVATASLFVATVVQPLATNGRGIDPANAVVTTVAQRVESTHGHDHTVVTAGAAQREQAQ